MICMKQMLKQPKTLQHDALAVIPCWTCFEVMVVNKLIGAGGIAPTSGFTKFEVRRLERLGCRVSRGQVEVTARLWKYLASVLQRELARKENY